MRRWVLWLACAASAFVVAEAVGGQPRRLACAIPLKGEIDAHLVESLSERLTQATRESRDSDDEKLTTSLVLLDLAVTGGPLDLALDLAEQIHNSKLETVAFVRKPGSAAATLLALACDRVFLANGARLVALDPAAFGSPDATATLLETVDAFSSERPRLHALYRGMVDPALAVHAVLEKGKQGKYSFFDGPEYEKKRASLQVKAYESVSEVGERAALTAADARRLTVIAGIEDSVGAVAGTFHVPGSLLVVLEQKGAATTTTTATKDRAAKSRDRNIPKTGPVVIIRLDGVVGKGMLHSVKRRLREAVALEPALLVFEMDTWGGALEEALDISDRIFDLEKPHTIAFVNDKAISAGVLISVACDEIFMVRGGKIGDCQVVTGSGEKVGREKIDTVLRAQFRTFCEGKYPLALSEAMVNEKAEIYQVTTRDGETEFLTGEQWENLTAAEREGYMPGSEKKILSDTKLLTMTDTEAVQLGFSTATVRDRAELLDTLGLSAREQITLDWTWSELFVRWLERVGPVFLTLGILGIIIELKTPGFGIPGILGLALIAVFFVGQHSAGMAEAWEIMLFGVGVALL
ncbi:hypothetical protein HQ560_16065, partial [bacterium]|nr:hypothetical protein [bacterium]